MEEPSPDTPSRGALHSTNVQLKRRRDRGRYERADVFPIIDEALLAHVAFSANGTAMTLPTAHARIDDQLYFHGARANRMLRSLAEAGRASATFTLIDGLVLARTAFHHSMNYRSVLVLGPIHEVTDVDEKRLALGALIEHIAPGRMRELQQPTAAELEQTLVLRLSIEEASAKTRSGDPVDAPADMDLPVWAGTVPLALTPSAPKPDAALHAGQADSNAAWLRALPRTAIRELEHGHYVLSNDPTRLQLDYIHKFLHDEAYWSKGIERGRVQQAMQRSLCFGVYLGERQVGFARVLTDTARMAFLSDVFVDAAERGHGLGKALVAFVLEDALLRAVERWLLGTADAHALYERFGFERVIDSRFMVRRKTPAAVSG